MAYTSWSVVFGEQPSAAKWNILGTNDAHFYAFLGDNEAWQNWTPTLTNLSGGTTTFAKYIQIGNTVFFRFKYTLGGAGVAGSVDVTFPVTAAHAATSENVIATVQLTDTGTTSFEGKAVFIDTSKFRIQSINTAGTTATAANLSSTSPHTWANTDVIYAAGVYEAA